MPTDFVLPELGENVTDGDVLRILVKPGDTVAKDQPVLELETDKATIEVPSSVAGRVVDIAVKPGEKVKVGQTILRVDADGGGEARAATEPKAVPKDQAAAPEEQPAPAAKAAAPPAAAAAAPEPDDEPEQPAPAQTPSAPAAQDSGASRGRKVVDISRGVRQPAEAPEPSLPPAPAAPSVRRMARELGVDISEVPGSGSGGRISIEDVKGHAKRLITSQQTAGARPAGAPAEPLPDFSRWGPIERQPMRAVRRKTAEHLSVAWATVAHVTQHDEADITALEDLRKKYGKTVEAAGGNLTVTAVAVKIVASALKRFPQFNSAIDLAADELIYRQYVNIGIAVDTDRGLLVPVVKDADKKNLVEIAVEIGELSEKARNRKITLDEMQGGCFSISNLGGIGGSFFTPIVNAPEVAILGISRAKMQPVYDKATGNFTPRLMLPLSLSYDHRVIDGADGIRFLRWVVEALEQPFVLMLQG